MILWPLWCAMNALWVLWMLWLLWWKPGFADKDYNHHGATVGPQRNRNSWVPASSACGFWILTPWLRLIFSLRMGTLYPHVHPSVNPLFSHSADSHYSSVTASYSMTAQQCHRLTTSSSSTVHYSMYLRMSGQRGCENLCRQLIWCFSRVFHIFQIANTLFHQFRFMPHVFPFLSIAYNGLCPLSRAVAQPQSDLTHFHPHTTSYALFLPTENSEKITITWNCWFLWVYQHNDFICWH